MAEKDKLDDQMTVVDGQAYTPSGTKTTAQAHDDMATMVADQAVKDAVSDDPGQRFQIVEEIGRGGMGVVFKARDRKLGRIVALKCVRPENLENQKTIERFWREAKTIAGLNQFNVIQIYNVIEKGANLWIEMEYVSGGSLKERVAAKGPLSAEETAEVGAQICDALAAAHEKGICHRDIKPGNIMLTDRGSPKLGDFGLARETGGQGEEDMTLPGAMMGTMFFASPEQLTSGSNVDARSDIYGLGATLYTISTGTIPRTIRLDRVPEALRAILAKCLEEHPDKRYQSAEDLKKELSRIRKGGAAAGAGQACPGCGFMNPEDVRFCQKCGQTLKSLFRKCPRCGQDNRKEVQFCGKCGANVPALFLVRKAQKALNENDFATAGKAFEKALEADPENEAAQLGLQRVVRTREEVDKLTERAKAAAKHGDKETVFEALREVVTLDPGRKKAREQVESLKEEVFDMRLRRAKTAMAVKKYERAHELIKSVLAVDPNHREALERLAELAKFYKPAGELERPKTAPQVSMGYTTRTVNKAAYKLVALGLVVGFLMLLLLWPNSQDDERAQRQQAPNDLLAKTTLQSAQGAAFVFLNNHPGEPVSLKGLKESGFSGAQGVVLEITDPNPGDFRMLAYHVNGNFEYLLGAKGKIESKPRDR